MDGIWQQVNGVQCLYEQAAIYEVCHDYTMSQGANPRHTVWNLALRWVKQQQYPPRLVHPDH